MRWVVVAVWAALLVVRIVMAAHHPEMDLSTFGVVEVGAIVLGLAVIALGVRHAWTMRLRRVDDALGLAIRRIDPTVWLVPATPTEELRDAVAAARPGIVLGRRVTWAFGATEASLWELDDRKATRVLVVRWRRVVHVGLEDVRVGRRTLPAVVLHHVRADDQPAVATFFVRRGPGATALTTDREQLGHLVATLAAERVVA